MNKHQKNNSLDGFLVIKSIEEAKAFAHNKRRYLYILREISSLMRNKSGETRILDIGTSPFTFILREKFKNAQIYSIDYTNKYKKYCMQKGINFKRVDLNKQKLSFGAVRFDLVTFLEVIEHLNIDNRKIIENIADLMVAGGYCIIQTPNKYSLKVQVGGILTRFKGSKFPTLQLAQAGLVHIKEYSLGELSKVLMGIKRIKMIKKEHTIYLDEMDSALVFRKYVRLSKPLILVNYWIVRAIPFLRRGMQIVFQRVN